MSDRPSRVMGVARPVPPKPLPGFEAVNDLGVAIKREQMRELREAAEAAVIQMRVMRHHDSPLCRAADRLEKAIRAIPATS